MLPSRGALRLRIEDFGGSGCRVFFWRDFVLFLKGSWEAKTLISHGRGSKDYKFTEVRIISFFWLDVGGHFETKISLKWRLASPCAALGSHLDRFWGVRKFALNKFYGNGRYRTGTDWKSSQVGWQSLSIRSAIWLDLLYIHIYIYIYIYIYNIYKINNYLDKMIQTNTYRRSNHMADRLDRLWPWRDLGTACFAAIRGALTDRSVWPTWLGTFFAIPTSV